MKKVLSVQIFFNNFFNYFSLFILFIYNSTIYNRNFFDFFAPECCMIIIYVTDPLFQGVFVSYFFFALSCMCYFCPYPYIISYILYHYLRCLAPGVISTHLFFAWLIMQLFAHFIQLTNLQ